MNVSALNLKGSDGKDLNCLLYARDDEKPQARGILLVPGRPLFPTNYEWIIKPLVEAGFSVAGLYQRGYGSAGIDDRSGPKAVDAVRKTAQYLVSKKIMKRGIGLIGHSSGAQVALIAGAEDTRIRCIVALSPIADLVAHTKSIRSYLPDYTTEQKDIFGEVYEDSLDQYAIRSPLNYVDRIKVPVLLVSGDMDRVCPPYQAKMLHKELEKQNVKTRLVSIGWGGHFFESYGFKGYLFDEVLREVKAWLSDAFGG